MSASGDDGAIAFATDADIEAQRLAALHALGILDTAPEPIFDRLTEVAAKVFRAPVALITLIDTDRQWFKSCCGFAGASETPRQVAFCDYTIRQDRVLVVPDATRHPVFRDNPLVTGEPHVRFYAGAPLIVADGSRLGSLCIIDFAPRSDFTPEQEAELEAMAAAVSAAMVNRRDVAAYVALEARLREADRGRRETEQALSFLTEHSADLILRTDPSATLTWVSPSCRAFGYAVDELVGRSVSELIHPDDLWKLAARRPDRFARLKDPAPGEPAKDYRIRTRDGRWVWVEENPTIVRDPAGRPVELVNVLRDITDRKRAEQAAAEIQAGMLEPREALARLSPLVEVDAVLAPARTVGGDLYDVFLLPDGPAGPRLGFLLGDVTGKGLGASLFMALAKALAHSFVSRHPDDLAAAFTDLAAELSRSNRETMGLSLIAGVLDLATGALSLCSAGMEHPLVLGPDGQVTELDLEGGPPLCVEPGYPYRAETHRLEPGCVLIAMTDGVTEAESPAGHPFGQAGVRAALAAAPAGAALPALVDALVAAVRALEAGGDPTDDLAMVALRRPATQMGIVQTIP